MSTASHDGTDQAVPSPSLWGWWVNLRRGKNSC
jgi:hypothetical protein